MSKKKLTRLFNGLSLWDRLSLQGAALITTMASSIRDDVKLRPHRFALFAAPLALMVVPLPIPAHHIAPPLLMFAWAKMRLTPWACEVDDRLQKAFHEVAMVRDNAIHIKKEQDGTYNVDNTALGLATVKRAAAHSWQAAAAAGRHVRSLVSSVSPV